MIDIATHDEAEDAIKAVCVWLKACREHEPFFDESAYYGMVRDWCAELLLAVSPLGKGKAKTKVDYMALSKATQNALREKYGLEPIP